MDKKDRAAVDEFIESTELSDGDAFKTMFNQLAEGCIHMGAEFMADHKDAHYKPAIDRAVEKITSAEGMIEGGAPGFALEMLAEALKALTEAAG